MSNTQSQTDRFNRVRQMFAIHSSLGVRLDRHVVETS
jgi:hypothetical protein